MAEETVNTDENSENESTQTEQAARVIIKHVPVASKGKFASDDDLEETISKDKDGGVMIPKARFDQVNEQKKEALKDLQTVADELAEDVPEEFRDLIPNLTPAGKIGWLRRAQKAGIFNKNVNGLDSRRPGGGKPPMDLSNMSPMEMMSQGYK